MHALAAAANMFHLHGLEFATEAVVNQELQTKRREQSCVARSGASEAQQLK